MLNANVFERHIRNAPIDISVQEQQFFKWSPMVLCVQYVRLDFAQDIYSYIH